MMMSGKLLRLTGVLPAVLAVLAMPAQSRPTAQPTPEQVAHSQEYLTNHGWLDSPQSRTGSLQSFSDKLTKFQEFAGLPVTGELDEATVAMMHIPRCGVRDTVGLVQHQRRRKRYVLEGSKWSDKNLTYRIVNFSKNIDIPETKKIMKKAFQVWADVSAMSFKEVSGNADIEISFENEDRGDGKPFDGPGGALAYALYPSSGGDVHFDKSENFTADNTSSQEDDTEIELFKLAAHEFGHSLGLVHSANSTALMSPFHQAGLDGDIVNQDDINRIQTLYGPPAPATPPATA